MTSSSQLESEVELHSTQRVAASSRVMWIDLSLLVVFFVKFLKDNTGKGCRVWAPGNIMYACWGRRVPAWFSECFMTVHAFRQKRFPPLCPSVKPPQRLKIAAGDRKSLFCVERPLLGRLPFLGDLRPL